MDNWICQDCGEVIGVGEFDTERECVYANDRPDLYFENDKCPHCGGCDFDEAARCSGCGEFFKKDDLDEDNYCSDCREHEKNKTTRGIKNGRNELPKQKM